MLQKNYCSYFVERVTNPSMTTAQAANTGLNANNINLVGLVRTGLDYLPYPS